jgi:UDP-glucose 4-epimerase
MNVLVTGGAGFLGSYVVNGLAEAGHRPVIFDTVAPREEAAIVLRKMNSSWKHVVGHTGDVARLLDVCRSEKIDAIIHVAALVGLDLSLAQPLMTYQTNIIGTANVCEVARQIGVAKLVYISSNAVYHKGRGESLHETDPVFSISAGNPAGHYGASKMAAEAIGLTYMTFHGLDFLSLRITAVYGFGMRQSMYIKHMVENAVLGRPTHFDTGGPMKRDYTYVIDCAEAICRAVDTKSDQSVLNVSSGSLYTASAVAEMVRRIMPGAQIEIGDSLTPTEAENVKMRAPLNLDRAKLALNWKPRWSLEEGIRDYAERYRQFTSSH